MNNQNLDKSKEISNHFYKISAIINDLFKERTEDRATLAKELIAKIKSVRNRDGRRYLIYSCLTKENFFYNIKSHLSENEEDLIDNTIFLLAPIQASFGFSNFEVKESIAAVLAKSIENSNNEKFATLERRFINLLESPRELLNSKLFSLVSIMNSASAVYNIDWHQFYLDIYKWDNNKNTQKKWAREFYKNLNFVSDKKTKNKE